MIAPETEQAIENAKHVRILRGTKLFVMNVMISLQINGHVHTYMLNLLLTSKGAISHVQD